MKRIVKKMLLMAAVLTMLLSVSVFAEDRIGWDYSGSKGYLTEVKQEIPLNQFFGMESFFECARSFKGLKGVTYSSSNPYIAKIDNATGKMTTLNKGTVTITAKYAGKSYPVKVTIKTAGAYSISKYLSAKSVLKKTYLGKKITNTNLLSTIKAYASFEKYYKIIQKQSVCIDDMYYVNRVLYDNTDDEKCYYFTDTIESYIRKYGPAGENSKAPFKFKSSKITAAAGTNTVTAYLNTNVTKQQIAMMMYEFTDSSTCKKIAASTLKSVTIKSTDLFDTDDLPYFTLEDWTDLYCTYKFTAGSNKVTIKLYKDFGMKKPYKLTKKNNQEDYRCYFNFPDNMRLNSISSVAVKVK